MTTNQPSNIYQLLLSNVAKQRGWDQTQTQLFDVWRRRVAQFESRGRPDALQEGGGPGRGMFQYELSQGGSGANKTAINRFKTLMRKFKIPSNLLPPSDKKVLQSKDPDFSKLSPATQSAIFLADKDQDEATRLNDLVNPSRFNEESFKQWRAGHWKGDSKEEPDKKARWLKEFGGVTN